METSQEKTEATNESLLNTIAADAQNSAMNLESFLDDEYLKGELINDTPVEMSSCRSKRGSTGHAWQS